MANTERSLFPLYVPSPRYCFFLERREAASPPRALAGATSLLDILATEGLVIVMQADTDHYGVDNHRVKFILPEVI